MASIITMNAVIVKSGSVTLDTNRALLLHHYNFLSGFYHYRKGYVDRCMVIGETTKYYPSIERTLLTGPFSINHHMNKKRGEPYEYKAGQTSF